MPMTMTGDEMAQNWLKTAAMQAAAKTYGPLYGDPAVADQTMQAQTRAATLPYAAPEAAANVAKTTADTGLTQSETAKNAQATQRGNMFTVAKMMQKPDGTVDTSLLDNPAVQQFAGIPADQAAQLKQTLAGPDGPQRLQQFLSAGMGPAGAMIKGGGTVAVDAQGNPSIYHTTATGGLVDTPLPAGSSTAPLQNAQTNRAALPIRQQNANTSSYSAGVRANNSEFGAPQGQGAPGTPSDGQLASFVAAHGGKLDAAIAASPNDAFTNALGDYGSRLARGAASPSTSPTAYIDALPPKGRQVAIAGAQAVVNANTMLSNTTKIMDVADKQIGSFTTGPGGELAHLPGTAATDLEHNLETIKANVAQAVLTSMKGTNGSTGIGRILQSEYGNFQKVLGAVDPTQSAGAVRFHLGLVRQSLTRMNQVLNDSYKQQWKTDPYTALGEKNPNAPNASDAALLAKYGVH